MPIRGLLPDPPEGEFIWGHSLTCRPSPCMDPEAPCWGFRADERTAVEEAVAEAQTIFEGALTARDIADVTGWPLPVQADRAALKEAIRALGSRRSSSNGNGAEPKVPKRTHLKPGELDKAVREFVTSHDDDRFTTSEAAARAGLSHGSALLGLQRMEEEGLVVKTGQKATTKAVSHNVPSVEWQRVNAKQDPVTLRVTTL